MKSFLFAGFFLASIVSSHAQIVVVPVGPNQQQQRDAAGARSLDRIQRESDAQQQAQQQQYQAQVAAYRLQEAAKALYAINPTDPAASQRLSQWAVANIALIDAKTGNSALRAKYDELNHAINAPRDDSRQAQIDQLTRQIQELSRRLQELKR